MSSSGRGSSTKTKGESEPKDDFKALNTMEDDLRREDQLLDVQKQLMAMGAMSALKKGGDQQEILNSYVQQLFAINSAKQTAIADKHHATRLLDKVTSWDERVQEKRVGDSYVLNKVGRNYIPERNQFTKEELTYGAVKSVAEKLNYSKDPGAFGQYPLRDAEDKIITRKGPDGNEYPVMATMKDPLHPIYENDAFDKELTTERGTIMQAELAKFGGGTNMDKNAIVPLGNSFMIPTTKWENSTNTAGLYKTFATFTEGMSIDAQKNLWDQFWKTVETDNEITYTGPMQMDKKGNISYNETVQTQRTQILDTKYMKTLVEKEKTLGERMGNAPTTADKQAWQDVQNQKEKHIYDAFIKYSVARVGNKLNPAIQVKSGQTTTYGGTYGGTGGGGKKDPTLLHSIWGAWQTDQFLKLGLSMGEAVEMSYLDKDGKTKIIVNKPLSPVIAQDDGFQKDYQGMIRGLFQGKGFSIYPDGIKDKQGNVLAGPGWKVSQAESEEVNSIAWKDFQKNFPDAIKLFRDPERKDWAQRLWSNYRSDRYDEFLYNKATPEWKERMIPGSTTKVKDFTTVAREGRKESGLFAEMGNGPMLSVYTTPQANPSPTYRQAVGHDMFSASGSITQRVFPYTDFPKQTQEGSSLYGKALDPGTEIQVGNTWMTIRDLNNSNEASADFKRPVVHEFLRMYPYYAGKDGKLAPMADAYVLMTEEQLKNIPVTIDGDEKKFSDLSAIQKGKLGMQRFTLGGKAGEGDEVGQHKKITEGISLGGLRSVTNGQLWKVPTKINLRGYFQQDINYIVDKSQGDDNLFEERAWIDLMNVAYDKISKQDDMNDYVTE